MEQQHIGWDNFLCGKLSKQWRIYQLNYEKTQRHQQSIPNRIKELKASLLKKKTTKKKKKKKPPPNVFRTLIGSIFTAAHDKIWTQRNKDRHKRTNHTSATAVEKIDNQVKFLYTKIDSVLTYEREKYFPLPLHKMLQRMLKKKQQWALRWKTGIYHSEKRAKKEAANKTLPIWQYFTKHKNPDSPVKRNRDKKSNRAIRRKNKKLFDQPIYALFPPADANRSTSRPPKLKPLKHPNVEQPSVLDHFNRRRIADSYPDGWIE